MEEPKQQGLVLYAVVTVEGVSPVDKRLELLPMMPSLCSHPVDACFKPWAMKHSVLLKLSDVMGFRWHFGVIVIVVIDPVEWSELAV